MPISEIEKKRADATLREYCEGKTKPEIRHELEIVYRFDGLFAYVSERRPDWKDKSVYRNHDVAKFRFSVTTREWTLFWRDRNLKWHRFEDCPASTDLGDLLGVVDEHPIFYG